MAINYHVNQALIRVKAAMDNLEEVMNTKMDKDERWALAYKFPFGENIETVTIKVDEWVAEHYIDEEEDENE